MITSDAALQQLQQALTLERLPPVWLLTGADSGAVVHQFALDVLVRTVQGIPSDTIRHQVQTGIYPNLFKLTVTKETSVEDVRLLLAYLQKSAPLLGWRVVILENLDLLNRNGANALLKTLEEPPQETLFLLTAQSIAKVLPTIRSRCTRLSLMTSSPVAGAYEEAYMVMSAAAQGNFQQVAAFVEKTAADEASLTEGLNSLKECLYRVIIEAHRSGDKAISTQKPIEHWLAVQEALVQFLSEAQPAHLDRKHLLMACFILIENPEALHL